MAQSFNLKTDKRLLPWREKMQKSSKSKLVAISSLLLLATLLFSYASTVVSNGQSPNTAVASTLTSDFGITTSVSSIIINAGTTQTTQNITINLNSINRYNGTITLTANSPSEIAYHIATPALAVKYNQPEQTTISLSVSSRTYDGKYTVTITGHDGSVTHSVNVTVQVVHPDVSINRPSDPTSIAYGFPELYTVHVSSLNGYRGSIHLKAGGTDFLCTFLPDSVTLLPGESKNVILRLQLTRAISEGGHSITITSTNDYGIMHSASFSVLVIRPDFSISVSPPSKSVAAGKDTYCTIKLQSINRFNGSIGFSTSHPVGWSTPVFSSSSISVDYNHISSASVTISVPAGTPSGKYTISITASTVRYPGKAMSYTARVTIDVLNP